MIDFTAAREAMVDGQIRPSGVTLYPVLKAFMDVPREVYVPQDKKSVAYVGEHIALSPDRKLMAARLQAKMLNELDLKPHELVLDVAGGTGYSTAIIAQLAEAVVMVEENDALADKAESTLSEQGVDNAIVVRNPLSEGAAKHGPFDVIVIEGGIEDFPATLLDQLKEGGRVAAFFDDSGNFACHIGHKQNGRIYWNAKFDGVVPILNGFAAEKAFTF